MQHLDKEIDNCVIFPAKSKFLRQSSSWLYRVFSPFQRDKIASPIMTTGSDSACNKARINDSSVKFLNIRHVNNGALWGP